MSKQRASENNITVSKPECHEVKCLSRGFFSRMCLFFPFSIPHQFGPIRSSVFYETHLKHRPISVPTHFVFGAICIFVYAWPFGVEEAVFIKRCFWWANEWVCLALVEITRYSLNRGKSSTLPLYDVFSCNIYSTYLFSHWQHSNCMGNDLFAALVSFVFIFHTSNSDTTSLEKILWNLCDIHIL